MDDSLTIPVVTLAVVFVPLALVVARQLLPSLRPPKHRPLLFISGGGLLLMFGLLAIYTLRPAIESGVVHFTSRAFGELNASIAHQPYEYWLIVLLIYACGVFLAGFGLAGFGLCFRTQGSEP